MNYFRKWLLTTFLLLPVYCFAVDLTASKIQVSAEIVFAFNLALFVTAVVSIKQYIWHSGENRMPFHVFNIIFTVLFYSISIPFLIANRSYYEEYQNLTPLGVVGKFFFTPGMSTFSQWVIIAAVVFNILYIKRFYRDYYEAGIGEDHYEEEENEEEEEATASEEEHTALP